MLVIGSQSILGSFREDELPIEATRSIEADIAFLDDPNESKSDRVDGAIGEDSRFHESFGVYGQGVGLATAVLPEGWQDRLVAFDDAEADPSDALCLEPHDLVVSKLVAGREKDYGFARALAAAGFVCLDVLRERAASLPGPPGVSRRVLRWLDGLSQDIER